MQSAEAMNHLGDMYYKGTGVGKDIEKAKEWCVFFTLSLSLSLSLLSLSLSLSLSHTLLLAQEYRKGQGLVHLARHARTHTRTYAHTHAHIHTHTVDNGKGPGA